MEKYEHLNPGGKLAAILSLAFLLLPAAAAARGSATTAPAQKGTAHPDYVFQTRQSRLTRQDQDMLASARIHSVAMLKDYLTQIDLRTSPLRYLAPAARARFLSSLVFNRDGLTSFDYRDLVQLDLLPMAEILQLFGANNMTRPLLTCFAPLTLAMSDRHAAAVTAGLVAACRNYDIDTQAYIESAAGNYTRRTARRMYRQYLHYFSTYQNARILADLSNADVHILFNLATDVTLANSEDPAPQRDLRLDFAELARRHIAEASDIRHVYTSYVDLRNFAEARRFAAEYPQAGLPALPKIVAAGAPSPGTPSELLASADSRTMVRRAVDLARGLKIVVVVTPECHFARHGLSAISADPLLKAVFEKHAVWLAPGFNGLQFDVYQKWNRDHPQEKIGVAYLRRDWPAIDSWALPTFYFFNDGRLVTKLVGWPTGAGRSYPDSGSVAALKAALKKVGLR